MKALSVKQPWANMIAYGEKTIETRTWATDYRGDILIVSSRNPPIQPAGCAVAIATIVDCRDMTRADELAARCPIYANAKAWVLENVRRLEPFPVKGSLGIYEAAVTEDQLKSATE
jgi:hypothetical protein